MGLYCGSPSVSWGSLHVFRRLNRSGRCALSADRLRRYRSRQSVRCLTSRSAAFSSDSSVNSQRPSTRIAPAGGLPLGRLCSSISKGKESARDRLNDAHCWHGSHCHHICAVDVSCFFWRALNLRGWFPPFQMLFLWSMKRLIPRSRRVGQGHLPIRWLMRFAGSKTSM